LIVPGSIIQQSTVSELVDCVNEVYWSQKRETLDNVFLTLQQALKGALSVEGDNDYQLERVGKNRLRRAGTLPETFTCPPNLIAMGRDLVDFYESSGGKP